MPAYAWLFCFLLTGLSISITGSDTRIYNHRYREEFSRPDEKSHHKSPQLNLAKIIQEEQRHLQLLNPDVEAPLGPTQRHPEKPERGKLNGETMKLKIGLQLGRHSIPALEYEVPKSWFDEAAVKSSSRMGSHQIQAKSSQKEPPHRPSAYTSWSPWTSCMGICDKGIRERIRECRKGSGSACDQDMLRERKDCSLPPCTEREKFFVHAPEYGQWGSWSPCTATCGTAHRTRVRTCLKGKCEPELLRMKTDCDGLPSCFGNFRHSANSPARHNHVTGRKHRHQFLSKADISLSSEIESPAAAAKPPHSAEHPSSLTCGQIPVDELKFFEIDYGKKIGDLKRQPALQGPGYVNLRLLAQRSNAQNHNNHIALEIDLGRRRRVEQLLFKGALEEGLPAILRAFYLQFLDEQGKDWRWLSHGGKPTPFIVTEIPVLNHEQIQTVFSVRFTQSLFTMKLRLYPELWQKLPVIRMAVVACG